MMRLLKNSLLLSLALLGGCVPFWREWMHDDRPAPIATAAQPHETWCYTTLGQIDCYAGPQRLSPESLVSVDPPSRYPLTRADYVKAVNAYEMTRGAE